MFKDSPCLRHPVFEASVLCVGAQVFQIVKKVDVKLNHILQCILIE